MNLANFKQYSDNFLNKTFFLSASLPGSGAIVAAIVVGVIIIFTVVLLILKTYNRYVVEFCTSVELPIAIQLNLLLQESSQYLSWETPQQVSALLMLSLLPFQAHASEA